MGISDISQIFTFAGGLGFFLLGMMMMSDGLQKRTGEKMRHWMNLLTSNRFLGVVVGMVITIILQSSSATSVMVIGFVNSGVMSLTQSVGVIMGGNIGTTVTAWFVSLNEVGSVLKPDFFAPVMVAIGAFYFVFSKSNRKKEIGGIIFGFGSLFVGLKFMSQAVKPYTNSQIFKDAFIFLGKNPFLALLVGLIITAIIQSSSASLGILQTLAISGQVTTGSAIFIALGQNIGTCVTTLISSFGASRVAKRAAIIHLLFNVIGAIIFSIFGWFFFFIYPEWVSRSISAVELSIFHTSFNIINTIILFPLANQLVKLACWVIPISEAETCEIDDVSVTASRLDKRLLQNPSLALETVEREVLRFGEVVLDNLKLANQAFLERDTQKIERCLRKEKEINKINAMLVEFVVELSKLSLSDEAHVHIDHLLYTISNMERVGDHAENMVELTQTMTESNIFFNELELKEISIFYNKTIESFYTSIEARRHRQAKWVTQTLSNEDEVDRLDKIFRANETDRLIKGEASAINGVFFLDMLSNLERVSDHASNIAEYVEAELV